MWSSGPRRRTVDTVLIAGGAVVVTVVLAAAAGRLTWGSCVADDCVGDELAAQIIIVPDAAALEEEGRTIEHTGSTQP